MILAIDDTRLTYNSDSKIWKYDFQDAANTIAYSESLSELRRLVDWAENNIRLAEFDGGMTS